MIDIDDYPKVDLIFVAFGSNDWSHREDMDEYVVVCKGFFEKLVLVYPNIPIYVILPIWRANYQDQKPVGTFQAAREKIKQISRRFENTRIVELYEVIPHELSLFSDDGLHPNDDGFAYYAQGVLKQISV